jgi:hypothetical protein
MVYQIMNRKSIPDTQTHSYCSYGQRQPTAIATHLLSPSQFSKKTMSCETAHLYFNLLVNKLVANSIGSIGRFQPICFVFTAFTIELVN